MKKIIYIMTALFLFIPNANAKEIDGFYTKSANTIKQTDIINGSSAVAASKAIINNKVSGINFVAGAQINYKGNSDYLVACGNEIKVNGNVENDTIIAGNIVTINDKALLQRDTTIAAKEVQIKGGIGRNIHIYASKVKITKASIQGNLTVYAENIEIDDDTLIGGMLSYPIDAKTNISSKIINVRKTKSLLNEEKNISNILINKLWSFLSLVFIFAILSLLFPKIFEKIAKNYEKVDFNKATEILTKGLVTLIIAPSLAIVLLLLPFATPLSLIILALLAIAIYLSKIFAAYFIGYKIWQKYLKTDINILLVGLLGLCALLIVDFIPSVNILSGLLALLLGIGIIIELIKK